MQRQLLRSVLLLSVLVLLPVTGRAQVVTSCLDPGGYPACDGSCLPGQACVDTGPACACLPAAEPCQTASGPTCDGDCPLNQACRLFSGGCKCEPVPALSSWGIGALALAMMGFVFFRAPARRGGAGRPARNPSGLGNGAKA